jgi:oligoendopeptidase F
MTAEPASDLGALPSWDLADLYSGRDAPELARDLRDAAAAAKDFEEAHAGKLAELSPPAFGAAIADYEAQQERLGRIGSYAYLVFCKAMEDAEIGRFYQTTQEALNDITTHLLFFTLETNKLDDATLEAKLGDPVAARYRPWLRDVRAFRPYQLSEELEKLLHEKAVTGRDAWTRLFDETIASLRFRVGDRDLTEAEALDLFHAPDREVRREAAHEIGRVFGHNVRTFATVMNTLVKDKEIEDRWRGFPRPISSRNVANHVEDAVVEALIAAVRDSYPRLSHRYYALKARWFGGETLDYWDRNAPLPDEDAGTIAWPDAVTTVLDAYEAFSPELRRLAEPFFVRPWVDAAAMPGKAGGAFAHPTVPSAHPYLLLNYQGRAHDVMTLAHELGHGVHQVLAAGQGALMADTPLTLAETASVFGEQLTFRRLLAREKDRGRRRVLLARKVEDMLNTVVRQIAFCDFERRVHDERRSGELTAERLSEIWMGVQGESLGPALRFDDAYKAYWTYIPHFIHTPFYVYAYAFGDCLVNALYAVYESSAEGFQERYLAMLRAGGTLRHRELLAPFGLDASDPAFWSRGLDLIARTIDELAAT